MAFENVDNTDSPGQQTTISSAELIKMAKWFRELVKELDVGCWTKLDDENTCQLLGFWLEILSSGELNQLHSM